MTSKADRKAAAKAAHQHKPTKPAAPPPVIAPPAPEGKTLAHQQAEADAPELTEEQAQAEANPDLPPADAAANDLDAPPATDSTGVEDLPPQTDEEKARDAKLMRLQAETDAAPTPTPVVAKPKEAPFVLVHNTSSRLMTVALFAPVDPKRPGVSSKTFDLLPGVNRVKREQWASAVSREVSVQRLIQVGDLVELDGKSLLELKIPAAIALVDLTVDRTLLAEWAAAETRPGVKQKLAAQYQKIAPTPAPKVTNPADEDEEDDQE